MIPNHNIRQVFLILMIIGVGYLLAKNLYFIFDAVLGAIILAILSMKPIIFLTNRKIKKTNAEWIYLIGTILATVIPIIGGIIVLKNQWPAIYSFINNYKETIHLLENEINAKLGFDLINNEVIKSAALKVTVFIPKLLNSTLELLTTLGVMYFCLYFFIKEGSALRSGLLNLMPLKDENRNKLYEMIYSSVWSNTLMMPMVAFVQAILAWISYLIIGLPNSFIWFLATIVLAMLPFFGAALVYIPLGAYLIISGQTNYGIFILLWGIIVVSSSDNVLRIFFMKKFDDTHPLITFLGVLAGLNIFGFLGIIFGPLLVSLFLILLKIYREEYRS